MNYYKTLFSELNKAQIEYMIVGGVAVNLYGYSRFTSDVDIIVLVNDENLTKIDKLAKQLNFTPRQPLDIDILTKESLDFKKYNKQKTIIKIWDLELPVININDLIHLKQNSNRPKDLEDLEALLKFKQES